MSQKILLVKKLRDETRACSVVVGEAGFYWRAFANAHDVGVALRKENFSLLIFDHRGVSGDPLAFIESIGETQRNKTVFLISDPLQLDCVVQAIRAGVKDLFQAPVDLRAIIQRVQAVLQSREGGVAGVQIEEWSEFVMFLTHGTITADVHSAHPMAGNAPSAAELAQRSFLAAERDQLANEVKALREALSQAQQDHDRVGATSPNPVSNNASAVTEPTVSARAQEELD
jgi:DNA-binding response OmpR family regulator